MRSCRLLLTIYQRGNIRLIINCGRVHSLLRHVYHSRVRGRDLRVASLSTEVDFMNTGAKLACTRRGHLRAFHLASGQILGRRLIPAQRGLLQSIGALTFLVHGLSNRSIPIRLCHLLPHASTACLITPPTLRHIRQVHIYFRCTSRRCLCMAPLSRMSRGPCLIHCGVPRVGRRFTRAYQLL